MRQKSVQSESPSERIGKKIRRATRKHHSSEEKIRIVLDGLRGESSIAGGVLGEHCRGRCRTKVQFLHLQNRDDAHDLYQPTSDLSFRQFKNRNNQK